MRAYDTFPAVLDLITAGEAFDDFVFHGLDRLPRAGEELKTAGFARSPGGGAVITAVAAARLGVRAAALTGIGSDAVRLLRRERVRVYNLRRASEPTAMTVALSTRKDRSFVTFNGMNDSLPGRIHQKLPRISARHVHFAFHPSPCRPWIAALDALRRRRIATSWDFGWNPGLARDPHFWKLTDAVDYVFLNRDEALCYARARTLGAAFERWRRTHGLAIVKLGAGGSRAVGRDVDLRTAAPHVRAVDTTGAGDAFNAGFLAGRLRGQGLRASLALANRVGAWSTRAAGGIAALPTLKDVW